MEIMESQRHPERFVKSGGPDTDREFLARAAY
jgi:hypothetical protein